MAAITNDGYFMLLLPELATWQGFLLPRLTITEAFVEDVRNNMSSMSHNPRHCLSLAAEIGLSDDDAACVAVLGAMLVHDAMALNLIGICAAAAGIYHVAKTPFFWIEGRKYDDLIHCSIGLLQSTSVGLAQVECELIGLNKGYV